MKNHIEFNHEGFLDEVVTDGGAHLERLGADEWFLECVRADGSSVAIWLEGSVRSLEQRKVSRLKLDPEPVVNAGDILDAAKSCVNGDRSKTHGERSGDTIADLWSAYLGEKATARDVYIMMALLKLGRAWEGDAGHADHWTDMAGYVALAGEEAIGEQESAK